MRRLCVFVLVLGAGCGAVTRLDAAFNRAQQELGRQGVDWQNTLQDLERQARQDGKDILADDVHNLITQTVAAVGTEFRCNADFVSHRVAAGLQTIWARFVGKPPPPRPAIVCQVTPNVVDLRAHPIAVQFDGYDFDQHVLQAVYVRTPQSGGTGGATIDLSASLTRPSPKYQVTLANPEGVLEAPGTLTLSSVDGENVGAISTVSVVRTCPERRAATPPHVIGAFSTTDSQVGGLFGSSADRLFGGTCTPGFHHKECRVAQRSVTGDANCGLWHWRDPGNPHDCGCIVHWGAAVFAGVTCDVLIDQEQDVAPDFLPPGCP